MTSSRHIYSQNCSGYQRTSFHSLMKPNILDFTEELFSKKLNILVQCLRARNTGNEILLYKAPVVHSSVTVGNQTVTFRNISNEI